MIRQAGLVGSAIDLVRVYVALDGARRPSLLRPETVAKMLDPLPESKPGERGTDRSLRSSLK